MKVVVIGRGRPTSEFPNNGIFEFEQAKALAKVHDVTFIGLDFRSFKSRRKLGVKQSSLGRLKIIDVNFPLGRLPFNITSIVRSMLLRNLLRKYKTINNIDIMHFHFYVNAMRFNFNGLEDIGKVITLHSSHHILRDEDSQFRKDITKMLLNFDSVISVSSNLQKKIMENYSRESIRVGNIISTSTFKYKERVRREVFTFVTVSNFTPNKNTKKVIQSILDLIENGFKVELKIVGTGIEYKKCKEFVESKGMAEYVHFYGFCSQSEVCKIFESSDCYLQFSDHETFGLSMLEAISTGLPVITTKSGGPEEFMTELNGNYVELEKWDELLSTQKDYIKRHLWLSRNVVKETLRRFSKEELVNRLTKEYELLTRQE